MKHSDFGSLVEEVKEKEYQELYKAIEVHGGSCKWDEDEEHPIIAANPKSCSSPIDIEVIEVSIRDGMLVLFGYEKGECWYEMEFEANDVFAGHLSHIIDYIPAVEDVKDVSSPISVRTLFGDAAVMAYDCGKKTWQAFLESGERYGYSERAFETEAEKDAYVAGVADANGWSDYVVLPNGEAIDGLEVTMI
jgi:hypothetical protein